MTSSQWQHHIKAWQHSKQSKHSYCHDHGISYSRFLYWSNKRVKQRPDSVSPDMELLPVTVTDNDPIVECLGVVEFPNGTKLHIHSIELLSSLPALLSSCNVSAI